MHKFKLIKSGQSRRAFVPAAIVEQYAVGGGVVLEIKHAYVIIRGLREGWDEAFRRMHARGDDRLIDQEPAHSETNWDAAEWTW
jgi:hypothetical protein